MVERSGKHITSALHMVERSGKHITSALHMVERSGKRLRSNRKAERGIQRAKPFVLCL